jgi:predicted protein tyrosine phosphatase
LQNTLTSTPVTASTSFRTKKKVPQNLQKKYLEKFVIYADLSNNYDFNGVGSLEILNKKISGNSNW